MNQICSKLTVKKAPQYGKLDVKNTRRLLNFFCKSTIKTVIFVKVDPYTWVSRWSFSRAHFFSAFLIQVIFFFFLLGVCILPCFYFFRFLEAYEVFSTLRKVKSGIERNETNPLKVTSATKLFFVIKQRFMCN